MPRGDGTGSGGRGMGRGQDGGGGRGRMGGPFAAGPGGKCVCPKCGKKAPHVIGTPCNRISCPECGTIMTRE